MIIPNICIIGDVVVDITLNTIGDNKLRLGGIAHAARGIWSLDIPYDVGFFCPQYLDTQIQNYLNHHGCKNLIKLGNVIGAPYVFFIQEVKEIGNQGYEFILKDEIKLRYYEDELDVLSKKLYSDILLISGNYSLKEVINKTNSQSNLHLDLANNIIDLSDFQQNSRKFKTIFISTSSSFFQNNYKNDFKLFSKYFEGYTERLVLKENRGGSRAIDFNKNVVISIPSQTRPIVHSVGVGDVYDAAYVFNYEKYSFEDTLNISSWVASEYAVTTYPDDFKRNVTQIMASNINQLKDLGGVSLPWENRKNINIYIAAPDFDFINTRPIDTLCESLLYHNFNPRRPIKENGQMEIGASFARKQELFVKDMNLLYECQMLVAVLLNNDPGTLIEIGIACTKGIPTLVYDPYNQATNCMLTQIPNLITADLDELISEIFTFGAKLMSNDR